MKRREKNTAKQNKPGVRIRVKESLDKYENIVLFPEKLTLANELLKGVKLP